MSSPVPPLLAILVLAILGGGWVLEAQDPPTDPPRPESESQSGKTGDRPQEKDSGADAKNPLDDPKMQRKAKLGKMLAKKRCVICHKVEGRGGVLSPPMEEVTARRFERMETYGEYIAQLKARDPARYRASKKVFDAIEKESNHYRKVMLWLDAYLDKPTFDNAQAKMTKQILKPAEVEQLIAYLLTLEPEEPESDEKEPAKKDSN